MYVLQKLGNCQLFWTIVNDVRSLWWPRVISHTSIFQPKHGQTVQSAQKLVSNNTVALCNEVFHYLLMSFSSRPVQRCT